MAYILTGTIYRLNGVTLWRNGSVKRKNGADRFFSKAKLFSTGEIFSRLSGRKPRQETGADLEGTARRKNAIFWSKFSKKCLKTPFLDCFYKFLTAAQKMLPKKD